jgi:hypothetical protein
MCDSTWKNAAAKNHNTARWRSTGSTGTLASCAGMASLRSGRNQTLAVTAASVSVVQAGKWPMPACSNQAPAANTVTRKPSEPHSRTRP